jgi:hypothetical protein
VLLPFFKWMESLAVFGASIYLGPGLNLVHLTAMVTFLGALLIVDLRLLGAGLTHQPVAVVARDARPWLLGGFAVLVLTGVPAMMATATAQYGNSVFWVKMYLIGIGLIYTFTVRSRVAFAGEGRVGSGTAKAVGLVSMLIWLSVASLARLIMMIPGNTFEWLVGRSVVR